MFDKIEHIGIAVKDMAVSKKLFSSLFNQNAYKEEEVTSENVNTVFFQTGESKIELLEATNSDSAIAKFIEKKGEGIHHIAFAVSNTNDSLMLAKKNGFRTIDDVSRRGAENLNIGFLNPKSTLNVLIEFCSK